MLNITEQNGPAGTRYLVQEVDGNGEIVNERFVEISIQQGTTSTGQSLHMLYDSNMTPIYDAIKFINFGGMANQSENYRLQTLSALKFFFSYLEIFGVDAKNMTKKNAVAFLAFLQGISQNGLLYKTNYTTQRSNQTVASYLKGLRKFLRFMEYDNHVLLKKNQQMTTVLMPDTLGAKTTETYDIQVQVQNSKYVPAYINVDEYKRVLEATAKTKTPKRDRIICRLMFEHGLRLGEVLGLTLEDIGYKQIQDDTLQYRLELRNRLSDTAQQHAKGAMNVLSADDYKRPEYKRNGSGYQSIVLSDDLAMELFDYINEAHDSEKETYMKRHDEKAAADHVKKSIMDIDGNFYVFLNTIGSPLSENLWNKNLRQIFVDAGLQVDTGKRKNNLSHRFRHGYAMYLTNVMHVDDFSVKTLMRHKNLSTTAMYHNPTPADIDELQQSLLGKLADLISEQAEQ